MPRSRRGSGCSEGQRWRRGLRRAGERERRRHSQQQPLHRSCPGHTRVATESSEPLAISSASRAAAASSTRCDGESSSPCTPGRNESTRKSRLGSAGPVCPLGTRFRCLATSPRGLCLGLLASGSGSACGGGAVGGGGSLGGRRLSYRGRLGRDLHGRGGRGLLWRRPGSSPPEPGPGRPRAPAGRRRAAAQRLRRPRKGRGNEQKSQSWHKEARGGENSGRPGAQEGRSLRLQALHPP